MIRDTINQGISKATRAKGPVVAKIVQSPKGNYVITTLEPYTAQTLISNIKVVEEAFKAYFTTKWETPTTWIKLVAYGILVTSFKDFKKEVEAYNNLQLVGQPRWLVQPKKQAGSVVFAVKSETAKSKCLRKGLTFKGSQIKVVKYLEFSPKTQCY